MRYKRFLLFIIGVLITEGALLLYLEQNKRNGVNEGEAPVLEERYYPSVSSIKCPDRFVAEQTEGPYYKIGSPKRTVLRESDIAGNPVSIEGYVFSKNCKPIAGVWIDFWQADGNGNYDNEGYKFRGHQFTDENGKYHVETVMPGEYPGRTPHIHVKLQANEKGRIFTTQLYFPEGSSNSADAIFDSFMLVAIKESDGEILARYNFKLDVE